MRGLAISRSKRGLPQAGARVEDHELCHGLKLFKETWAQPSIIMVGFNRRHGADSLRSYSIEYTRPSPE